MNDWINELAQATSILTYYIPIIISIFCFNKINDNPKKLLGFAAAFSLFLILSLRYDIGWDYIHYVNQISRGEHITYFPIPRLIAEISLGMGSPLWFFSITAAIQALLIYKAFLNVNRIELILVYICLPFFFIESFSIVRQQLALAFCIYAYSQYVKNSPYYLLSLLLASFCHISSILFALSMIILRTDNKKLNYISIVAISFIGMIYLQFQEELISLLPNIAFYNNSIQYGLFFTAASCILLLISYNKYEERRHYIFILQGVIISIILINFDSVFTRLSYYFFIPYCFLKWSHIMRNVKINRLQFSLGLMIIFSLGIYTKAQQDVGSFLPYKTFLNLNIK